MSGRALILGARSAIAEALARRLAAAGRPLVLAARRVSTLAPMAADLRLRYGQTVDLVEYDALDLEGAATFPQRVHQECGEFDLALLVFGYLGDQRLAEQDTAALRRIIDTNYTAAAVVLGHLANFFVERDRPAALVGIGSVAGDRGRQSNYVYGAAKGALALYLQGLRNRLARTQVHVLTVKPGFVDTPMTEGMEGLFLVASPDRVAVDILVALQRRQDVLYTPWFWRWIMLGVRAIPEPLFKRMKL